MVRNIPNNNLKTAAIVTVPVALFVETANHIFDSVKALNYVYEYPRNSYQASIYARETFRIPYFWSLLGKKAVFGTLQHTLDVGFRLSCYKWVFGGTWSPNKYADMNTLKYLGTSYIAAFASCWSGIPFDVARKAYFADLTWPKELRKGYSSPLHALCKIAVTEGPFYLFKGGFMNYIGNVHIMGVMLFSYSWIRNKTFFLHLYHDFTDWSIKIPSQLKQRFGFLVRNRNRLRLSIYWSEEPNGPLA